MSRPLLLSGKFSIEDLEKLRSHKIWQTNDIYENQLKELYEIAYPGDETEEFTAFAARKGLGELAGAWVYYPWSGVLLHCVDKDDLFTLRTNRNKNLVDQTEQQKLSSATIAVAGMSVGSSIALSCVYSGISDRIKIADFDDLETVNLNRLRETLSDIGKSKAELAAQHIYELNPFAEIEQFGTISDKNIDEFFADVQVVVDEIDDFKMKVRLRLKAKEKKVPLLMFTSLGDNILIDVERYDKDPQPLIFNGAIGDVADEIINNSNIKPDDLKRYAVQTVGQEYVPTRALSSLPEIGKTLVGRPQLYSTIAVDGGLAAFLIRSLILGVPLKSGRYFVSFSTLFGLPKTDFEDNRERKDILRHLGLS